MFDFIVEINSPESALKDLRITLHSWLHVVREYTYRVPRDLKDPSNLDYTWWSKERSQVGFFSIAAWLNGWAVLQEWGTEKYGWKGRNDLWIGRDEMEFLIEAKQGNCRLDDKVNSIETQIQKLMALAYQDAKSLLPKNENQKRTAAVFITPSWNSSERRDFDEIRSTWISAVSRASDAVAAIVPSWEKCAIGADGYRFVGSALLLQSV